MLDKQKNQKKLASDFLNPKSKLTIFLLRHKQASMISLKRMLRAPLSNLLTLLVISIALAFPSGLFVVLRNLQNVVSDWNKDAQLSVFLKTGATALQIQELTNQLKSQAAIKSIKYISPQQGLREFKTNSGFGDVIDQLGNNPLPAVIEVQINTNIQSSALQELAATIEKLPQVDSVQMDLQWVQRLLGIVNLIKKIVYAFAFLLGCGVLLIIGNTIRLMIQSHHDEIEVVKLIGGTDRFVRRPFLYSGLFYGLFGGILAWILIALFMLFMKSAITHVASLYNSQFIIRSLDPIAISVLLGSSIILGMLGAWIAVGKHIRALEADI